MATAGPAIESDFDEALKARILARPDIVLDDIDVMRRLVEAGHGPVQADNVIDLRAMAMDRLETRLLQLEETHQAVIAAAYDNLASTRQIQSALLRLLDETGFEGFLGALGGEVAQILKIASVRLVLESPQDAREPSLRRVSEVVTVAAPGAVAAAMQGQAGRQVVLRDHVADSGLHGARAGVVRSEALLRLDLGEGRLPGMLVLGSADAAQFRPGQGTDLLAFLASGFERMLRRWLT